MFLPDELAKTFDMLPDESCGRVIRSLFSGKAPEGGIELVIYTTIKAFLDCQQPSVSEVMSERGRKGGRPKKSSFPDEKAAFENEKAAFENEKAAFSEKKAAFENEKLASEEEEGSPFPLSSPSLLPPTPPIITPPIIPQPLQEEEGNDNITIIAHAHEEEMPFGLTEEEALASLQRDQQIEDAASNAGLNTSITSMENAKRLADTYGMGKLLDAIQKTPLSAAKPSWGYVEGILKGNGTKTKPVKVVSAQQYGQRDYTEAQLDDGGFAALVAEAKAARSG